MSNLETNPNEMNKRLKEASASEAVPAHLEMRVRAAIRAQESTQMQQPAQARPTWFAPAWGFAAAAAVLAVGLFTLRREENSLIAKVSQTASALMRVGLGDHLHCTLLRKQRSSPIPLESMRQELGPQYSGLLPAVEAHVPRNYQVLDAHQCRAQGRDFVHLVLNQGDRFISVVVTRQQPGESFFTENLVPALAQAGIPFYQQGTGTFQIAAFEGSKHLVYVISDLPKEENRQLMMAMAGELKQALPVL